MVFKKNGIGIAYYCLSCQRLNLRLSYDFSEAGILHATQNRFLYISRALGMSRSEEPFIISGVSFAIRLVTIEIVEGKLVNPNRGKAIQ